MLNPNLKSHDICKSGSGRHYAVCHVPIYTVPRSRAIKVAQESYPREPRVNADHYAIGGPYQVLAGKPAVASDLRRVLAAGMP